MSLYLCKSKVHSSGYEYDGSFILVTRPNETLPDNIDQILTAWEFGLDVSVVEEQGDEVWSDCRIVSCWVDKEMPDDHFDVARKYLNGINLYYILGSVDYGDERDEEVA